jgi:hypothetical protein
MSDTVNIKRIIDVSTAVAASSQGRRDFRNALFIFQGAQVGSTRIGLVDSYETAIEVYGSNTEVVKAAETFFAGGFNGIKPQNLYVANFNTESDTWSDVITEILSNSSYYWISCDKNFTLEEKEALASAVEASSVNKFFFMADDNIAAAVAEDKDTDETSLVAYAYANKLSHTAVIYSDIGQESEYHSVAAISYFATVDFTASRPLGSLAHKQFAGIQASTLSAAPTPTIGFDNLDSKNGTAYVAFGETGRNVMERGNCGAGTDIAITYAADYIDYTITYNIFDLLTRIPALRFTAEGKAQLYSAIVSAFKDLKASGVIAGGTDPDTGIEYINGYNIDIPLNISRTKKQQGLWDGIVCIGLLSGFCKKIVVSNTLKL